MEALITRLQNALAKFTFQIPLGQDLKIEILVDTNKERYEIEQLIRDWRSQTPDHVQAVSGSLEL